MQHKFAKLIRRRGLSALKATVIGNRLRVPLERSGAEGVLNSEKREEISTEKPHENVGTNCVYHGHRPPISLCREWQNFIPGYSQGNLAFAMPEIHWKPAARGEKNFLHTRKKSFDSESDYNQAVA